MNIYLRLIPAEDGLRGPKLGCLRAVVLYPGKVPLAPPSFAFFPLCFQSAGLGCEIQNLQNNTDHLIYFATCSTDVEL